MKQIFDPQKLTKCPKWEVKFIITFRSIRVKKNNLFLDSHEQKQSLLEHNKGRSTVYPRQFKKGAVPCLPLYEIASFLALVKIKKPFYNICLHIKYVIYFLVFPTTKKKGTVNE